MSDVRNITEALATLTAPWQPHRLVSLNDDDVTVVELEGEFVWHTHPDTDELFVVVSGELTIQLRDRDVVLGPMDVVVVPAASSTAPARTPRCTPCSSSPAARSRPATPVARAPPRCASWVEGRASRTAATPSLP